MTFDELVSTGSLRLLSDRTFKRRLAEWYDRFDYQAQWYPSYRRMEAATEVALRGITPIEIRLEGSEGVSRVAEDFDGAAVVAALRANEDMVPILEDSIWTQHRVIMGPKRFSRTSPSYAPCLIRSWPIDPPREKGGVRALSPLRNLSHRF